MSYGSTLSTPGAGARPRRLARLLLAAGGLAALPWPGAAQSPELQILSAGEMEYELESRTMRSEEPVEARYGPFFLEAGRFRWSQDTGEVALGGGVLLRHEPEAGAPAAAEDLPLARAWIPDRLARVPYRVEAETVEAAGGAREIRAEGGVRALFPEGRLLAEEATFAEDATAGTPSLEARRVRGGDGRLLAEATSLRQEDGVLTWEDPVVHWGEPSWGSPRLRAGEATRATEGGPLRLSDVRVGLGPVPFLYFPQLTVGGREGRELRFFGDAGEQSNLGFFANAGVRFPLLPAVTAEPRISLYTRRGLLLSPDFTWKHRAPGEGIETAGEFRGGWIDDRGSTSLRGEDRFGREAGPQRGYAIARGRLNQEGGWSSTNQWEYWSDAAVLRDFRPGLYDQFFAPQSFSDFHLPLSGAWSLSGLVRARTVQQEDTVEKLPAVRIDLQPQALRALGGVRQRARAAVARLRRSDPDNHTLAEADQYSAEYQLARPFSVAGGWTLRPVAGVRARSFQAVSHSGKDGSRVLGSFGADFANVYEKSRPGPGGVWGFDRIRHRVRPAVGYRWMPAGGMDRADLPELQPTAYVSGIQPLGLAGLREQTAPGARQKVRLQLGNEWWGSESSRGAPDGRAEERLLARLDLYQDWRVDDRSPQGESGPDTASAVDLGLSPAPWLEAGGFARVDTHGFDAYEAGPRVEVREGDLWSSQLGYEFLKDRIGQLRWTLTSRISLRDRIRLRLHYDDRQGILSKQSYRWIRRVGRNWSVEASTTVRRDNQREGDVTFALGFRSRLF